MKSNTKIYANKKQIDAIKCNERAIGTDAKMVQGGKSGAIISHHGSELIAVMKNIIDNTFKTCNTDPACEIDNRDISDITVKIPDNLIMSNPRLDLEDSSLTQTPPPHVKNPKRVSIITYFHRDHDGKNGISVEDFIYPLLCDERQEYGKILKSIEWIKQYSYFKPYLNTRTKCDRFHEYSKVLQEYMLNKKAFSMTTENNLLPLFLHKNDAKPTSGILYDYYIDIITANRQNLAFEYESTDYVTINKITQFIVSILLVSDYKFRIAALDCRSLFLNINSYHDLPIGDRKNYINFEILYTGDTDSFDSFIQQYCEGYMNEWYDCRDKLFAKFNKLQNYVRENRTVYNKSKK